MASSQFCFVGGRVFRVRAFNFSICGSCPYTSPTFGTVFAGWWKGLSERLGAQDQRSSRLGQDFKGPHRPPTQDLGKFIHSAQTCFSFTKKSLALDESSFEKDESVNGAQLQPYLSTYVKILGCGLEEVKELFAAQVADAEEFIQKFEGLMKRFVVLVSADIKAAKSALEPYRQWVY